MPTHADWIGLRLDPLDPLFFRDGRPFDAANRVQAGMPTPQTLAGAVRTTLLAATGFFARPGRPTLDDIQTHGDPAVTKAEFRGPFLALTNGTNVEPLFEPPLVVALDDKGSWLRRSPSKAELPGWDDPDKLLPVVWEPNRQPDAKAEPRLLTLAGVRAVLDGGVPADDQSIEAKQLSTFDDRTGIVIDTNTLATKKGELYGIRLMALNPDIEKGPWAGWSVGLYAELRPGDGGKLDCGKALKGTPIPFGGEGKYVRATATPTPLLGPPAFDPARSTSMWYLPTPTFLPRNRPSRRPLPDGALRAAVSGAGLAVSGWDTVRRGPNATRFAVPAGACYFFDSAESEDGFLDSNLNDITNLRQSGWGFALQGTWEDRT